ncbi:hypothetical protein K490DRAFT_61092 [Saccharata proteae CBS 121410]|uniref:BZIP domain-containing protein n=1 Tax=Saccharata proteae CBS 121410 TaxID=1314787 RepID=A0A9P4LZZ4_9PEZI|nr:hypothetical protein K490DRAFT_61092 [Saccharata proteae CBS 121410]
MPTQDPIKRRDQNRDNQKRFRERQSQTIASLRETVDNQAKDIAALQHEIQELRTDNGVAETTIANLRTVNSKHLELSRQISVCLGRLQSENLSLNLSDLGLTDSFLSLLAEIQPGISEESFAILPSTTPSGSEGQIQALPISTTGLAPPTSLSMDLNVHGPTYSLPGKNSWRTQLPDRHHYHGSVMVAEVSDDMPDATSPPVVDPAAISPNAPCYVGEVSTLHQHTPEYTLDFMGIVPHINHIISHPLAGDEDAIAANLLTYPLNSRISRYIHAGNLVLKQQISGASHQMIQSKASCKDAVQAAVSWMLRNSWPISYDCLNYMTIFEQLYNYELWRNFPNKYTYDRIHPAYRPTHMQLCVPHHPAIDWLPWPQLRDKAIENQDSLDIDLLNMHALQHTVIHGGSGTLPRNSQSSGPIAFRVWDVYQLQKARSDAEPSASGYQMNIDLSQVKQMAFAEVSNLRLDKAFFQIFPQLWIPELVSEYQTEILPCVQLEALTYPSEFDSTHLESLQVAITNSQHTTVSAMQDLRRRQNSSAWIK